MRFSLQISVFSANAGKCGPEKLKIRRLFTQWSLGKLGISQKLTLESYQFVLGSTWRYVKKFESFTKTKLAKRKFSDNPVYSTWKSLNVLVESPFTTKNGAWYLV